MHTDLEDRARAARLTAAERKVVDYLRTRAAEAIFATAEQIAGAAGTSDATVVRTARALGYSGLAELRRSLAEPVVGRTGPGAHATELAGDDTATLLDRAFGEVGDRLARTRAAIDVAEFERAVTLLGEADDVLAYGVGPSEQVARMLAQRLSRIGRRARASGATGFRLADALVTLRPASLVVLLLPSRPTVEARVIVEHARETGARTVLVTDSLGVELGDRVDVVLPAVAASGELTAEAATSAMVTDALVLAHAARHRDQAVEASVRLNRLRSALTGHGPGDGTLTRTPGDPARH